MSMESPAPAPPPEPQPQPQPQMARATAGVIAPPPLIYLGVLGLGLAVDRLWLATSFDMPPSLRWTLALSALLAGGIFMGLAIARFRAAGTPPEPWQPATALVIEGVYKRTRNPMYVGLAFTQVALALMADAPIAAALVIVSLLIIRQGVVLREERYMAAKFGAAYHAYCARAPRWL